MLQKTKTEFYSSKIRDCGKDQKSLHKLSSCLLGRNKKVILPKHTSDEALANRFNSFFLTKIENIHSQLSDATQRTSAGVYPLDNPTFNSVLDQFQSVTEEEVTKLLKSSNLKSSQDDPIPAWLLQECTSELMPLITAIVNTSLSSGCVPTSLKCAKIKPLLKKPRLDPENLKHYRPVSNLTLLSKLIEKVVTIQLQQHLEVNCLQEQFQSAYKQRHSTETALLCVQNDLLESLDTNQIGVLLLLDLSAAFDTIDHSVLLHRLHNHCGISGTALAWFRSYLEDRKQAVAINNITSDTVSLDYGVPQGSVLGPKLFCIYTLPLGSIIQRHGLKYHLYADDTQLYVSLKLHHQPSATLL